MRPAGRVQTVLKARTPVHFQSTVGLALRTLYPCRPRIVDEAGAEILALTKEAKADMVRTAPRHAGTAPYCGSGMGPRSIVPGAVAVLEYGAGGRWISRGAYCMLTLVWCGVDRCGCGGRSCSEPRKARPQGCVTDATPRRRRSCRSDGAYCTVCAMLRALRLRSAQRSHRSLCIRVYVLLCGAGMLRGMASTAVCSALWPSPAAPAGWWLWCRSTGGR